MILYDLRTQLSYARNRSHFFDAQGYCRVGRGIFSPTFAASGVVVCSSKKSFKAGRTEILEMCYLQFYIGAAIKRASELIIILAYQIFTRACFQSRNQGNKRPLRRFDLPGRRFYAYLSVLIGQISGHFAVN